MNVTWFKTLFYISLIAIVLHSCVEVKHDTDTEEKFANADLIGMWKVKNLTQSGEIRSVELVNDSIADIVFKDSSGERHLTGKWKRSGTESAGGINFVYDIKLSYEHPGSNSSRILLGSLEEIAGKLTISSTKATLEKL
ncbi:hypothetical protein ACFSYG_07955 [Leeuwenhoekiella polynyae]|uniref:Lipocalin-like protein n=1 Tax=Leeuwenhoekiella polynyae TaxID=1550906 RepID=A0A4Q0NN51_9FLAO|nr:hypothetical protein [Leeuwenhoekiella polynyae]RXG11262.1 hypothetical protein DSM02_4124 [Leeuwenhoekiella polynyae]